MLSYHVNEIVNREAHATPPEAIVELVLLLNVSEDFCEAKYPASAREDPFDTTTDL